MTGGFHMPDPVRILLVDDDEDDFLFLFLWPRR